MTAQPTLRERLAKVPTPMGGLALGIASLGWAWENLMPAHGLFQLAGAGVAAILLLLLLATLFFVALLLLIGVLVSHLLSPFRHTIVRVTSSQPAGPPVCCAAP